MTYNIDITGNAEFLDGQPGSFYLNANNSEIISSYAASITVKNPRERLRAEIQVRATYVRVGVKCQVSIALLIRPTSLDVKDFWVNLPFPASDTQFLGRNWILADRQTGDYPNGVENSFTNTSTSTPNIGATVTGCGIVSGSQYFIRDNAYRPISTLLFSDRWFYASFQYDTV